MTFQIKQNDTKVNLKTTLSNESGPVDLTGCTVRFLMLAYGQTELKVDRSVILHDAENGVVWFVFEDVDTDEPGHYKAEFEVVFPDARRETFPSNGFIKIEIQSDLG